MVKLLKEPMFFGGGISSALTAFALGTASLKGDVLYTTFGPGDTYDHSGGFAVIWDYRPGLSPQQQYGNGLALPFTVGQDSRLSSFTLEMEESLGRRNLAAVSVRADNAGSPGGILETMTLGSANLTNSPQPVTFTSSLQPVLSFSQTYWLVMEPANLNTTDGTSNVTYPWWRGLLGYPSTVGYREFDFSQNVWGGWSFASQIAPAFRVDGFAVPEPSAISLGVVGLGSAVLRRRSRQS